MRFYEQYPMMEPFVGARFRARRQPAILLIGESHYLPPTSTVHLDEAGWYRGTAEALTAIEVSWISTAQIVRAACAGRFKNKAFSIWRNSFRTINQQGPQYEDFAQVAEDLAFYNFFLRPARTGLSVRVGPLDVEHANEAFAHWCRELRPQLVVFLSALARKALQPANVMLPISVVPHPASQWWYRPSRTYAGKSGRDALAECVSNLEWKREEDPLRPSHSHGPRGA
jgi:hypothetical protein